MAVTDTNTPASELLVEALRDVQPRAYLYQYTDPMSGKPVWRSKGEPWNGQTPKQTEALYSVEQIALAAQPRDDVRELLREAREELMQAASITGNLNWQSDLNKLVTRIDARLNGEG